MRHLTWDQKGLHQFAFPTGNHAGKAFESWACGDFRQGVAPIAEQSYLSDGDFPSQRAFSQMLNQCASQLVTP
jgi:hypothetical protein